MELGLGEKIVKIKLNVPVINLVVGKEYEAVYSGFQQTYRVLNNINEYVYLSENLVEIVYDENYEEIYEKELQKASEEYKAAVSAALEKYKLNKTNVLKKQAEQKKIQEELDKKRAEEEAIKKANEEDLARKQAEQLEAEKRYLAEQAKLKADAIATAKREVELNIDGLKSSIEDKKNQIEKLEREISQIESNVTGVSDEDKQHIRIVYGQIEALKANIEKETEQLKFSEQQLNEITNINQ
jgi:chromosome segregation ATPase